MVLSEYQRFLAVQFLRKHFHKEWQKYKLKDRIKVTKLVPEFLINDFLHSDKDRKGQKFSKISCDLTGPSD